MVKGLTFWKNCTTYGSFYVGAEISQQLFLNNKNKEKRLTIDWVIIKNYAILGIFALGPTVSLWYQWLDRKYVLRNYQTVFKKLLLDQFCLSPVLLFIFFTGMSILGRNKDIFEDLKTKFKKTFAVSCVFWIPTQTINFLYIPAKYRVLVVSMCSFSWANILCWIKRK